MNEAKFQKELKESFSEIGMIAYKFFDLPVSALRGLQYVPEKPSDFVVFDGKTAFLVECKQIKKYESFGMRQMRPGQIRELNRITNSGGLGFVFLNVRIKSPHENKILIWEWSEFKSSCQTFGPFDIGELKAAEGLRAKAGVFNLQKFKIRLTLNLDNV